MTSELTPPSAASPPFRISTYVMAGAFRQEASLMYGFPIRGVERRCAVSFARVVVAATIGLALGGGTRGGGGPPAGEEPPFSRNHPPFFSRPGKTPGTPPSTE